MKVLVTCPPMLRSINEFEPQFAKAGIELITPNVVQTLTVNELLKIVPQADGWIIGDDPATLEVFQAGVKGNLKAAVKWGVGIDNVDLNAIKTLNLPFSNTPQMFGNEVADLAIGYLIGLARQSFYIDREVRKGNWVKPIGRTIQGKKIGVIGFGDIGKCVAKRLIAFETEITVYDPFAKPSNEELNDYSFHTFPHQIEELDDIIITCALNESNKQMINKNSIALMKNGVNIINVSRGGLINEADLISALKTQKINSVALDVFEEEPLPINNELRSFENCIFGTHNGSNTKEAVIRASNKAIALLFNFLNIQ